MRPHFRFARLAALTMISAATCLMASAGAAQDAPGKEPAKVVVTTPSANLNITPRRVVFDTVKRTEAVFVFNQGNSPVTVDVSLVDNVMLANGEIVPLDKLAQKSPADQAVAARLQSARDLILASPSRLTLPPGKGRTIRLRATAPATAGSAELRTHLAVTTVPSADSGLTAEAAAAPHAGELAFKIQSIFGISIPLILRNGPVEATATISDLKIATVEAPVGPTGEVRTVPALTFALARGGTGSIFGNLEVKSKDKNRNENMGFVRGLAVYPEISGRRVVIPLIRQPQPGETLTVSFTSDDPQLPNLHASGMLTVR